MANALWQGNIDFKKNPNLERYRSKVILVLSRCMHVDRHGSVTRGSQIRMPCKIRFCADSHPPPVTLQTAIRAHGAFACPPTPP